MSLAGAIPARSVLLNHVKGDMGENELIPSDDMPLVTQGYEDAKLDKLAQRSFLPYVKLVGATSTEGKTGKAKMGNFLLFNGKDSFVDLTASFEVLVLARRPRACRKTITGLTSIFDPDSPEYKKIQCESDGIGMKKQMGSWYGTEFLVWIRSQRVFAAFHASSQTARGNSLDLVNILKQWTLDLTTAAAAKKAGKEVPKVKNPQAAFKSAMLRGQGQDYWGPQFSPATTPFSELPTWEDIKEQCGKFVKQKGEEKETVEAAAVEDRG